MRESPLRYSSMKNQQSRKFGLLTNMPPLIRANNQQAVTDKIHRSAAFKADGTHKWIQILYSNAWGKVKA